MKFYYLTDDTEKSLTPFFSPKILSTVFYSVAITCVVSVAFWPWQFDMEKYLRQGKGPFVFFPVMAVVLVMYAYIHIRCGRGEIVKSRFSETYLQQLSTFEREYSFMRYAFVESLLHVSFSIFPVVPILMFATSVSGLSFVTLIQGVSIIFMAALFCRLIGFMTYLLWGRGGIIGYLIARVLMCLFLFVTAINLPIINPLRLLYALNKNEPNFEAFSSLEVSYWVNIGTVTGFILILTFINHTLVRRHMHRESELK